MLSGENARMLISKRGLGLTLPSHQLHELHIALTENSKIVKSVIAR